MFTGIVQELGEVVSLTALGGGADGIRLRVLGDLAADARAGDSIAVEGCCLTVVERGEDGRHWFEAEVMNQTRSLTTLGELEVGSAVNLEGALRAGEPLGGHIVQGHIDGVGEVVESREDGIARRLTVALPAGFERFVVEHGSITIAGVSLTVARLDVARIEVSLIPETLTRTTLGRAQPGGRVNLEFDVIARYVERLLGFRVEGKKETNG